MKLKLIAVAVMSLTASASFAAKPSSCGSTVDSIDYINWCAPEATLFIAGSSALKDNINSVLPDLFDMSTTDGTDKKVYRIFDKSAAGLVNGNGTTNSDLTKGAAVAYYGTSKSGVFGTQKRLLVIYNSNNGSGAGVSLVMGAVKAGKLVSGNPIESNNIYVGPTKNVANTCTSLGTAVSATLNNATYVFTSNVTCTNTADIQADLAISDVRAEEIYKFYSNVAKSVKFTNFTQVPIALQGFGLVVNWNMFTALQDAQVTSGALPTSCNTGADAAAILAARILPACQPSIRSVDYATLVKKDGTKSAAIFGLAVDGTTATKLTLLRRDDASGTQSASNIYFLRNSCQIGTALGGGVAVLDEATDGTNFAMIKHATSSGVRANATTGYTIGASALEERAIAANQYNYVKIDGMSPTAKSTSASGTVFAKGREAFAKGDYNFAMTAYGIYNKNLDSAMSDKSVLVSKTLTAIKDSTRHNSTGIAYIDGVTETTWAKQALVNRAGGNNCAPLLKN